jgi:RNA polymerase sigma factor (sigma-70 family)
MEEATPESHSAPGGAGAFTTTRWSVVLAAGHEDASRASSALEHLCAAYWYPLYAYVRRQGHGPEDAQDLTQDFLARFIGKGYFRRADPARGRFRTFLLTSLKHFLVNEWHKGRTERRGGGVPPVSWDQHIAEERYQLEPADGLTPEIIYERRWAVTLLEGVLSRMREEFRADGKAELFEAIKSCVSDSTDTESSAEIAARLGMTEGAVRAAAHRLRDRYRELLRAEVAQLVTAPADIDDEIRHPVTALRR